MGAELLRLIPEAGRGLQGRIRRDYIIVSSSLGHNEPFDAFSKEAPKKFQSFIPVPAELLASYNVDDLIQEGDNPEIINSAWTVWTDFLAGQELFPHIAVCGNIGSGKTTLAKALIGHYPKQLIKKATFSPELWQQNPYIGPFYEALAHRSEKLPQLQYLVQTRFAETKYRQGLKAMRILPHTAVVQDVDIGQDGVYFSTQEQLGLASEEYSRQYYKDNIRRRLLLPPYIRMPVLVYVWTPLEEAKRGLGERGRRMEQQMPKWYLESMHLNFLQWALAMKQVGVPLLVVDGEKCDFREEGQDGKIVAQSIWEKVANIHPKLVADMRQKFI